MSRPHRLLILALLWNALCCGVVCGQFGVPRTAEQAHVDAATGEASPYAALADQLQSQYAALPEQDAIDIAALLTAAKTDPETSLLLFRLKEGSGQDELAAVRAVSSPEQIVQDLAQALSELKMLEILFRNPVRAVEEMHKEGMIPVDSLAVYRMDPALLEKDTRQSIYFLFVSLGAAGGYL
jgi:hypothetical protein